MIRDPCEIAPRWLISMELAERLVRMDRHFEQLTGRTLEIISGHRTCQEQRLLEERGRPAAACELSTHVACPATGADLRMDGYASRQHRVAFGEAAIFSGLRWGGGSPITDGIPSDWNHVDLGPRTDGEAQRYRTEVLEEGRL